MIDLGAGADMRLLDFDEIADFCFGVQHCAGAQAGIGADLAAGADGRAFKVRKGPDRGAIGDGHAGAEHNMRFNHDIAANDRVVREPHCVRGDQGRAIGHGLRTALALPHDFDAREFGTGIDARDMVGRRFNDAADTAIGFRQHHDVGQIIFTRGIVVANAGKKRPQIGAAHGHQAAVAQAHGAFCLAGVLVFDHLFDAAIAVGNHAAISGGIIGAETKHDGGRRIGCRERIQHRLHRVCRHKWDIAIKDQDIAIEAGQRGFGLLHGMRGAKLRFLCDDGGASCDRLFDLRPVGADHHNLPAGRQGIDTGHEVEQHRTPGNRVKHLVQIGFHAGAFASGKNDGSHGSTIH